MRNRETIAYDLSREEGMVGQLLSAACEINKLVRLLNTDGVGVEVAVVTDEYGLPEVVVATVPRREPR